MAVRNSDRSRKQSDTVAKSKKKGLIFLLSTICLIMAFLISMTFVRFTAGTSKFNSLLGAIDLDYDLEGGVAYTYQLSEDNLEEVEDIEEVLDVIRYRLDELDYQAYSVKALQSTEEGVEDYTIRIEVEYRKPDTDKYPDADMLTLSKESVNAVMAYGELSFTGGTSNSSANPEILTEQNPVESAEFSGSFLGTDGNTYYLVSVKFNEYGNTEIQRLMKEAAESETASSFYMGVSLGEEVIFSQMQISDYWYDGETLMIPLSGEAYAKTVALRINSGGLGYKYELVGGDGVEIISPYGKNVALKSVIAVVAILVVAIVAYIVLYKGFGLIASLALILFALFETIMLSLVPGIVLSLGGVIGYILSLVLTAGAIAYIAEIVKSQFVNTEKTVKAAVKKGFNDSTKALITVFVACGILALLLLIFTIGVVKGFAITFGIGVIVGLISSLVFTRMFSSIILPLTDYKESFLGVKKGE